MAYVAPTTRADGYVVPAATWNQDVVANPIAINAGAVAIASQATGDLIVAASASQLGRVADVATGQVLASGGVGAAPAYTASPSVTALTASGTVAAATVTATGDIYTTAWTDYYASSTIVGWSSLTAGRRYINYKKIGKLVFVNFHLEGTSNSTAITFTLPDSCVNQYGTFGGVLTLTYNNGAALTTAGIVTLTGNSNQATCYSNGASGAWTGSGVKIVSGQFFYEAA